MVYADSDAYFKRYFHSLASPLGLTPLATRVSSFMVKLGLVFLENQNLVLF